MTFNVKSCFVLGALFLGSGSVFAGTYGMAGCGLGSLFLKPNGGHMSAAALNGTGGQTFAITSGTSNCKPSSDMAVIQKQEDFIASNLSVLSKEMAQGTGESLAAFSETLGCDGVAFASVANHLKANYQTIFKAPGAMAVLDTSKSILKGNPETSGKCRYLDI